jgi:hypothetical protein
MTSIHNPIIERIRRKKTQLDLNRRNRMHSMRAPNSSRTDFTQPNPPNLALRNQLRQRLYRRLDPNFRVDARAFEDIDLLGTVQYV